MFNEYEIDTLLEDNDILAAVVENRKNFVTREARFLEISEHDFLSLIMMTPSVGIALSNGRVSLFEELALNKMARRMSKGGFFLKHDPVAHAMKFLIKNYEAWEDPFFQVILLCMNKSFSYNEMINHEYPSFSDDNLRNCAHQMMHVPHGFVRFISSFFLHDENDIIQHREISKVEYNKILDLSVKLKLDKLGVFESFLKTFRVK